MSELPKGWATATLGELLPLSYGKGLTEAVRETTGEVPVLGSSGVVGRHDTSLTSGPALVVGRKGNVGSVHLSRVPCWPIDTVYYAEAPPELSLPYLEHVIRSRDLKRLDRSTAVPGLSRDDYNLVEVPVAPLPEQEHIVEAIESYFTRLDDAVATLERAQRNLKRYRASVLKAAVEGRLVPTEAERAREEGRGYEPASVLLARILVERRRRWEEAERAKMEAKGQAPKDDKWKSRYQAPGPADAKGLPELPEGWCWATVEAVGDVLLGRQRAPQYLTGRFNHPYLRVANIKDDHIAFDDVLEMDFEGEHFERYSLQPGDVLVSEGQSPELVGQSAIYRGGIEGLCFQKTLHRFRPVEGGPSSEYAQIVFRSHVKNGLFRRLASITTNIAHLTLIKFSASPFPLPPAPEQDRIAEEVDRLLTVAEAMERAMRKETLRLARLRQSVVKWAFEGKLADQNPLDEPAAALLARIRASRTPTATKSGRGRPKKEST